VLNTVREILDRCGTDTSVMPPTELYNEGWMLRLLLDWFDKHRGHHHALSFEPGAVWYSEALLPSKFLHTFRGDPLAESFTHADGVIGHFRVQSGVRGDATLTEYPTQFVVAEAKLGSPLSVGTKNAPFYDQAARNVACMAHMLASVGMPATSMKRLAFLVLAPEAQAKSGIFADLLTKESIHAKVSQRVAAYSGKHDVWLEQVFNPFLERIDIACLTWEQVLSEIPASADNSYLAAFYAQCLRFNPLRGLAAL
jgi:hypothetical protein